MIIIVMMLETTLANPGSSKVDTVVDQTVSNALSVPYDPAYVNEGRSELNARDRRDASRMEPPLVLLSNFQQNTTHDLANLADMCPYADICDHQGRDIQSSSLASCCLSCSCDPLCKEIGNCCDRRETTSYTCHSPILKQSEINTKERGGYFMVDKCLDGSNVSCKAQKAAEWGSLYPVYDSDLKLNFYNSHCAECSGANNYVNWGLKVACQGETMNDGDFLNALRGKLTGDCFIEFTPPKRMVSMNHLCSRTLISHCNETGRWENYDQTLVEACARWYSPVVSKMMGFLKYANIYCEQCNEPYKSDPEDLCAPATLTPGKSSIGKSVTLTIDYRRVSALVNKQSAGIEKPNKEGGCRRGTVKHISIGQPECRTVLCPNGFVRSGQECVPLSLKPLNDGYAVQLLLTPTSDALLPSSYLEQLTATQKQKPTTWFESHGASFDYIQMLYKRLSLKGRELVESFVVRLDRNKSPVNLKKEMHVLQESMKKPWTITLNGTVFDFSVKFYRYACALPLPTYGLTNILTDLAHTATQETIRYFQQDETYTYLEIDDAVSKAPVLINPYILKKTMFCNRVRLARSEWIAGYREIRLNTSEPVLDSNKTLGDSEFDIFLGEHGEPTVEICVDDFNPDYRNYVAAGTIVFLSNWSIMVTFFAILKIT